MTKKKAVLILVATLVIVLGFALAFRRDFANFPSAMIDKRGESYVISVSGRRGYMVHDPVSLLIDMFCPTTHVETENMTIPKDQGIIDSLNIWFADIHSPLVGTLTISGTDMVIDLRWDDPEMKPFIWNGKYRLSPGYKRAGDGDPKTCFQAE